MRNYSYFQYMGALIIAASFNCTTSFKSTSFSIPETELKRKIKASENHTYSLHLKAGEFIHLKIFQYDMDVVAKVSSLDNQFTATFDLPNGELDAEDIYLLSDSATRYEIAIIPAQKYADPGDYAIKTIKHRIASEADRKWMLVLTATQKADKLRSKAETREQSIEQYKLAAAEWKALNDIDQYARVIRSLGFVYIRHKNYDEAVQIFQNLLPVWKQVGDTRAEGFTHLIIGRIYNLQKNYQTSLKYNLSSLPYWRKVNDFDQETFTLMNIGNLYAHLNDKETAVSYFEQALKLNERSKRPSVKAVVLRDYATAMSSTGKPDKAIALYQQSINQWQQTVNAPEEARTYIQLASQYLKGENRTEAARQYRNAYAIWEKLNDQKEMKTVQNLIASLEKQKAL